MSFTLRLGLGLMTGWLCAAGGPGLAEAGDNRWFEAGRRAVELARAAGPQRSKAPAKNAILFVGDGMGISTVTAARILEGQLRGQPGEENRLAFEALPYVALAKTYNTNQQVPDSAGTMSAMVTGLKTKARVLSVDERVVPGDHRSVAKARVETIFEQAERRGLATGIVTTTRLTHATPAACYGHSADRDWEDDSKLPAAARADGFPDLARQLVEFSPGDGIEVALGGGRAQFLPKSQRDPEEADSHGARDDGRDLSAEWLGRHPNAAYVWNQEQFDAVDAQHTDHLLGLFDPSHMEFEFDRSRDRGGEPSLSQMTRKAIEILSRNPRGFLLVVEGGRIDHGHHAGNAFRALTDTIEFSNAVRTAVEMTDPGETLVVVTADHNHVLTMAGYPTRGNDILGLVFANDARGEPMDTPSRDALGLPYTTLSYANGPGYTGASSQQPAGPKHFPHRAAAQSGIAAGRTDLSGVNTTGPTYLQEATVPLPTETHGGEDVPIYAGGPGAELFHGVREQNYIYHAIVEALGWNSAKP